jgi:hypothetical protein
VLACIRIVTKAQCPQAINRNGSVGLVSELAEKLARIQIIRIDATVAEIADQQIITEPAKISGSEGQAPGRVEPAVRNEAEAGMASADEHCSVAHGLARLPPVASSGSWARPGQGAAGR